MPAELWSFIFIYTYATNFPSSGSQAIRLSHVCHSWRAIALSTSTLWTTINMTFPLTPRQMARTSAFLHRSKVSKLDIHLDFRDPSWCWGDLGRCNHPFGYKEMMLVMGMLVPHVTRWKNVELHADTWAPIYTFLSYCKGVRTSPALRRLSLSRCDAHYAENGQGFRPTSLRDPISLFGDAPLDSLQELILCGVHIDWSSVCLNRLKTLELAYLAEDVVPSMEQFVKMLDSCPQLENLTIMGRGPHIDAFNPTVAPVPMRDWLQWQSRIRLGHLKSFTFGFTDITYAIEVLFLFQFPALRSLTLEDMDKTLFSNDESYSTALLDILSDPSSGIKLHGIETLEFRGVRASQTAVTRFLRHCVSVEKLVTIGCSQLLINALRPLKHQAGKILLPSLAQILLGSCHDAEDAQHCRGLRDIFEAVFDRCMAQEGAPTLKEIYMIDDFGEEPRDEDLAFLLASGVKLLACT